MIRLLFLLALLPLSALAGSLEPAGRFTWKLDLENFGGFSGIEVFSDSSFLAVSDRGHFFTGKFLREDGKITSVDFDTHTPILDSHGNPVSKKNIDAEGLAVDIEGKLYVSFESNHRIMMHTTTLTPAIFVDKHPDFRGLQVNSGLEALAIDGDGVIYTIPERSGKLNRPFPLYRYDGEWTIPLSIPRREDFLIAGADFGPDGRFYVLERDFTWFGGFLTRIRRFTIADDTLLDEEVLLETQAGHFDNMEGISVWQDDSGTTRLTLISDDNFNLLQNTQIAEYLVLD